MHDFIYQIAGTYFVVGIAYMLSRFLVRPPDQVHIMPTPACFIHNGEKAFNVIQHNVYVNGAARGSYFTDVNITKRLDHSKYEIFCGSAADNLITIQEGEQDDTIKN